MVRWLLVTSVMVSGLAGAAGGATRPCSAAVIVSATSAKVLRQLQLPISSAVADGHGGWYVADVLVQHLRPDGSIDETWDSPMHRRLAYGERAAYGTLIRLGDRLYVAGRRRIVAVDARNGHVLWSSRSISGRSRSISALAADNRVVYVGGTFTGLGGVKRIGLAALDASSGRLLSWKAPGLFQPPSSPGWPPGSVSSLAYSGSRLYFAGTFGELGPKRVLRRAGVAAVRASDGALTTFSPRAQLSAAGALAVAGRLVLIGGGEGDGVFDSRTGRVVRGFAFDQIGSASAIAVNRSTAYLGGWFGGKNSLIAIDLRTARYRNWFPKIRDYYVTVSGIAVSGGRVLAGGSFCPGP